MRGVLVAAWLVTACAALGADVSVSVSTSLRSAPVSPATTEQRAEVTASQVDDGSDPAAAQDALATSSLMGFAKSCMYSGVRHKTVRHPTDPRRYSCGGHWMWFRESHRFARRCGKWYRNARSNDYFSGGQWKLEPVVAHPTNPTLVRRACRWVERRRTALVRRMFRSPSGIWYRNRTSREYYAAGKWGNHEKRTAHPTDPNLVLRAGRWVKGTGLRGQSHWTRRCNAWWRAAPGTGLASFQYYVKGSWRTVDGYSKFRNDPKYQWTSKCRFVRRPASAATRHYRRYGTRVYTRGALRGGGYWFKRRGSLSYYRNGAWRVASRHLQDPRWHRDPRTGVWRPRNPKTNPQLKLYVYDKATRVWWQTKRRLRYWWYGQWRLSKKAAEQAKARAAARRKRVRSVDRVTPVDLRGVVKGATDREFAQFMRWFTTKIVATTREVAPSRQGASLEELKRLDGHAPRRRTRSPGNPEPGLTSKRNKFNPEPRKGNRAKYLERIRETPVAEYVDTGAREPFWADKGAPPGDSVPSFTDSTGFGHATINEAPSKTGPGIEKTSDEKVARL
jgi:hypothetical protein